MPKVRSFSIHGVECIFHTNDHDPPHFHAIKGDDWEFRVWFLRGDKTMLEYDWHRRKASAKDQKGLITNAKLHRSGLFAEWQRARGIDNAQA